MRLPKSTPRGEDLFATVRRSDATAAQYRAQRRALAQRFAEFDTETTAKAIVDPTGKPPWLTPRDVFVDCNNLNGLGGLNTWASCRHPRLHLVGITSVPESYNCGGSFPYETTS